MLFPVPKEVVELAEIFDKNKKTLYIVGGYTRSGLLGLGREDDVDLASSTKPDEVIEILKKTDFDVYYRNQKTGVLVISKNGKEFEHATFRTENYAISGEHMPCEVEFIEDAKKDALRRDFTCNAMYYDPLTCELVDPLGGVEDVKAKVLRAVGSANVLFKNDAERILRMVRQSSTLGFVVERKTWEAAKNNIFRLKFLSKTRIRKELAKILCADAAYPMLNLKTAHVRAFSMLFELGAFKYLAPELEETFESACTISGLSTLDFACTLLSFCPKDIRLYAAFCVAGMQKYAKKKEIGAGFSKECADNVKYILENLEYSPKEINKAVACAEIFEKAIFDRLSMADAREIVLKTSNFAHGLEEFATAARAAALHKKISISKSANNLYIASKQFENKMFAAETNQLEISSYDILQIAGSLSNVEIAKIKRELLLIGARRGKFLSKDTNKKLVKQIVKIFEINRH